jgi:hypothetical protein
VLRLPELASPRQGFVGFAVWSGKGLRAFMPFILALTSLTSLLLAVQQRGPYAWMVAVETVVLAVAILGAIAPETWKLPGAVRVLGYVFTGYVASGLGALLYIAGRGSRVWQVSRVTKASDHAEEQHRGTRGRVTVNGNEKNPGELDISNTVRKIPNDAS